MRWHQSFFSVLLFLFCCLFVAHRSRRSPARSIKIYRGSWFVQGLGVVCGSAFPNQQVLDLESCFVSGTQPLILGGVKYGYPLQPFLRQVESFRLSELMNPVACAHWEQNFRMQWHPCPSSKKSWQNSAYVDHILSTSRQFVLWISERPNNSRFRTE